MRTVKTLLDEAAAACGGYAALGRRIDKTGPQLSDMKAGREPITPETVGLLADVLELPAEEARRLAALAVVENPKNRRHVEALRRGFFVCLALGAVTSVTTGEAMAHATHFTVYTLCAVLAVASCCALRLRGSWPAPMMAEQPDGS
jgi:hypothetical protein